MHGLRLYLRESSDATVPTRVEWLARLWKLHVITQTITRTFTGYKTWLVQWATCRNIEHTPISLFVTTVVAIKCDDAQYFATRLIWEMMEHEFPCSQPTERSVPSICNDNSHGKFEFTILLYHITTLKWTMAQKSAKMQKFTLSRFIVNAQLSILCFTVVGVE